ncbi:hypothetical protein B7P43_G16528 [Cryptotermes secundus]|uniref:Endonuclease/exonuclease/phosphatase domain-containing protein n=1 Tax=Cryptotermes secundus TaxID=105785 RepID=A0A2J7QUP0_9NEOP|nr:hypothetical protein B7P43_G16528 [Cryptotermes secundus]
MRFGTWNVRSTYRARSLKIVWEEISKYKLDLVGVHEVRWDGGGTEPAGEYIFSYGKRNENDELERVFDKNPKYHVNILLGDFNAKVCTEVVFKPTIGNKK